MSAGPDRPVRRCRRLAGLAAIGLAAGVLVSGCGVPSHTGVRVDGPIGGAGVRTTAGDVVSPPGPDAADDERELVRNFLQAAAEDPGDPVELLREFVHPDQRTRWRPDPQIVVVRAGDPVSTPADDRSRVRVEVEEIGVLTADGVVDSLPGGGRSHTVEFTVVEELDVRANEGVGVSVGDDAFWIVDPPDVVMLSVQALENEYLLPRPVYFWDEEGEELVPDLRWMPSALAGPQRAQILLDWLVEGPSPWLLSGGAVVGLPGDVALDGNVVSTERGLEVGFNAAAADLDQAGLEAQLWWTLRPELSGDSRLVLRIAGQPHEVGDYPLANPAVRDSPASFAVVDGVIRQYRPGAPQIELPALTEEANSGVRSAALTRDGRAAALVRPADEGPFRLELSRPGGVIATSLDGVTRMSRPLWLTTGQVGLVVADGDLYRFQAGRAAVDEVVVPGLSGTITEVAAAPDGHRLALVADGRLYMASMDWRAGGPVTVGAPRHLSTTATGLNGVGFLRENWLVVIGEDPGRNQQQLYEITVDGAYETPLLLGEPGVPAELGHVVAYPADPSDPERRGEVMYEADGLVWVYRFQREPDRIEAGDLLGTAEDAGEPRAPFFMD